MYYHSKEITDEIKDRVGHVADSMQLILGRETEEFERAVDEQLFVDAGRKSLLVSNGTVAIELAVRTLRGKKTVDNVAVFMPVLTVPMVKWAIERAGCVALPVDVSAYTHCMSPEKAMAEMTRYRDAEGEWPFALLFVYTGAMIPKDIDMLVDFCHARDVQFIEDVSHAYRTMRLSDGFVPGTVGNAVCGSLFATKVLSVGEAGIVRFDNPIDYSLARMIRHQGKNRQDIQMIDGYIFRASEFTAAVANVKLKHLSKEIAYRRFIVEQVYLPFADKHGLCVPHRQLGIQHSFYKFILQYPDAIRDELAMKVLGCPVSGAVHREIVFDDTALGQWPGARQVVHDHICAPLNSMNAARRFCGQYEYARLKENA